MAANNLRLAPCGDASAQALAQRADDAVELPASLIAAFAADLEASAVELRDAPDLQTLRAIAHRLTGSTATYGYLACSAEVQKIATHLRQSAVEWQEARTQLADLCRRAAIAIATATDPSQK
jgi:HPt (histidine-containing phosphotransfer) domain-containing protein